MNFDDEFSATNVNTAYWNINDGPNNANNEAEWYSPQNVYVTNGNLVLKSEVRTINGYNFASGKVTTAGKVSPHYGRIEVRAKLPTGQGIWPAHWLLPYGKWPPEIDITEVVGNAPKNLVTSYHRGPLPPGCVYPWDCGYTANTTVNWNLDWSQAFHTYAIEWDWWGIKWFVDEVEVFATYITPPDEPMFLILNTAVGGDWPGYPDGSTQWPQWHLIDFVRMYQRYAGNALLNGGFEEVADGGFLNWNTYNETTNIVSGAVPVNAHSGARAVKMSGRFDSPTNSTYLFQTLPAGEGQFWQTAVWAANRTGDLLQGRNNARLKLEFLDGSGGFLAQYPVTVVTSNTPAAYAKFSLRQKAPASTAQARVTIELNQYDNAAGAANFDDAELFLVTADADGTVRNLINDSFEQGDGNDFTSWIPYGALSNIVTEATAANIYQGSRAARLISVPDGSIPKTGLYQDIPSRAGEYWTASVWARSRAGDPLQGGNSGVLKLEFIDAAGIIIQTNEATVVTASSPASYTNAVIKLYSPVGTAFVRLTVECRQVAGGGGSVDFDLASLTTTTDTTKLINSGLELWTGTDFPAWTIYGTNNNVIKETNAVAARSGTNALRIFGQFPTNGAANESGIFQDMTASPGQIWQATVWAQNRASDGVQGSNQARLKLEFLDAAGAFLDRDEIITVSSNSPPGYQPFVLRRVAPDFTAKARIVMAFFQQNNAGGSANFDDAELRRVSVNESRRVLNAGFEDAVGSAFPNWPAWNNVIPNILPDASNYVHSGSAAVKMFGTFNAVSNTSGLFQDFPAQPNELWQASIWARSRPGDQLQGANSVRMKLEFYNTNNTVLGTNLLTILNAASSTNYQQFTIRRLTPAGTARARMVAEFLQPNYAAGAVNLDDAQMGVLTAADTNRALLNGGFETGQGTEFGEWIPYGPGSLQNVVRDTVTANARSGTQCLKLYGAFNGANNNSGLYQDIPVAPGEIWQASVWARNRPNDLLQGTNQALLKLEFVDSSGNTLSGNQVIAAKAGSPTNYQWFALRNLAPANAAFARLVIEFDQYASATGAVNIDDAQLQLVTAQSNPALLNGSFEYRGNTEFANWTEYGAGANVLPDSNTNNARTGTSALRIFGQSNNALNNSGLFQDVPATEGQLWQISVWARNRPGDSLQGGNYAQLKLEYLGTNGLVLTRSQLTTITAASSTNYQRFAVVRPAPAGTAKARLVLEMVQVNLAAGSVDYDDAEIVQITNLTGPQGAGRVMWDGSLQPNGIVSFDGDLLLGSTLTNLETVLSGTNAGLNFPQIQVAGNATLGGNLRLIIPTSAGGIVTNTFFIPRKGQTFQLLTAGTRSGTFANLYGPAALGGGNAFSLDYQTNGVVLHVVSELDTDGDGLPDYWEAAYFNSPLNASAAFDTDGDGRANLAEFTADTNPTNAQSNFRIQNVSNSVAGVAIYYQSSSARKYTLFSTPNPASGVWTNIPSQTGIPGSGGLDVLVDASPNIESRFYRLGVQLP